MRHFRMTFSMNLDLALAVYREARIEVTERGLILHHSKPPVAPKTSICARVPTLTATNDKPATLEKADLFVTVHPEKTAAL